MKPSILYVDLDGTLLRGDSLHEGLARLIGHPFDWPAVISALFKGKATLKGEVARRSDLDPASLPYRQDVLDWLRVQRASGRSLVLATGADQAIARSVADHLGMFDAVLASDGVVNLTGRHKLDAIRLHANGRAFGYVGDGKIDLQVWAGADSAVLIGAAVDYAPRLTGITIEASIPDRTNRFAAVLRQLRPHQWAKNTLVFLPALAAHRLAEAGILQAEVLLFAAFSLCASGVYALNDLLDLPNDRSHATKCRRPMACGDVSLPLGVLLASLLPLVSLGLAYQAVGLYGVGIILSYWCVTGYYSLHGKRVPLLDVFLLAALYTFRAVAGAYAVPAGLSVWMAAFLLFFCLGLACLKRFTELSALPENQRGEVAGRGYRKADATFIATMGVASGFAACLVVCLYAASPAVSVLYRQPMYLMGAAPLVLFGLGRFWLQAWRGELHSDPVMHALRDWVSLALLGACLALVFAASYA